jgi:pseudouridine-5'-phosphate glycosidase
VRVSPEVAAALAAHRPVVALESTIISHGMPYPANLATAREVEAAVRAAGAVPATVAVLDGVPCVGARRRSACLRPSRCCHTRGVAMLMASCARARPGGRGAGATGAAGHARGEDLSPGACDTPRAGARSCIRGASAHAASLSPQDLPFVVARGATGATTVSATMLLAAAAGVRVFVTGGIGGVHRGGEQTWDVSADLSELGRTPVAVVCAGAKSILDIPRTLEVLETQGVAVAAYQTDEFPAFYTRTSGVRAPWRLDSAAEAAAAIAAAARMGLAGGMVIAVPIPEGAAAEGAAVEAATQAALAEAAAAGVAGAAVTPFLLRRVAELTGGASLTANIALVKHNAAVGAAIAVALAPLLASQGAR